MKQSAISEKISDILENIAGAIRGEGEESEISEDLKDTLLSQEGVADQPHSSESLDHQTHTDLLKKLEAANTRLFASEATKPSS